ncbi:MAG: nitroreductase family protein [Neorhizobium sp.]|jgi:predicted oxidoreductase (fatty acid repression mutant protein)|nr:nitroreductase family protein [Neorhizobium sp.]
MSNDFIKAISLRRTQYALGKNLPISAEDVTKIIKEAVRLAPSSFNSQSSRAVILFGEQSEKIWSITKETLRAMVPADAFASTEAKMDSFAAGAGTVLFYEDQETIANLQEKFPLYAANFPIFSDHSAGMAQFAVWSALANAGIGASLQHYNPLIDAEIAETFGLSKSWKLCAQMPFGSNEKPFGEKTFIDDETRFAVFS